jgi:hypothetical protein
MPRTGLDGGDGGSGGAVGGMREHELVVVHPPVVRGVMQHQVRVLRRRGILKNGKMERVRHCEAEAKGAMRRVVSM